MFKPRSFLVLLALAMVGAVGFVLHSHNARTPASLMESAAARLEVTPPDFDLALRELDLALELALDRGERQLAQEVFLLRAKTYARRRNWPKAREDYATVLGEYLPGSPQVTLDIGWIDYQLENHNAALAAAAQVLAAVPAHSGANKLRGDTLLAMAERSLEEVEAQLQAFLADQPARRAHDLAWRAATLDFDHAYRSAVLSEFDELCGRDTTEMRRFIDAATTCLMASRRSFVDALQKQPNVGAMVSLLVLLEHGEAWNEIVDFGMAAAAFDNLHKNLPAVSALVRALDELGRPLLASSVLSSAAEEDLDMPPALLGTWCRLLYEAEDWARLENIGQAMQRREGPQARDLRRTASLFVGIAKLNLGKYREAVSQLELYTSNPPALEPIEDATAVAYYNLSKAYRAESNQPDEYRALTRATNNSRDFSGEAWQRLAELQLARREPLAQVAASMVQAIGLMPQRVDELVPTWERTSLEAMAERQRSIEATRRRMRDNGRWVPAGDRNALSFEFWRLGRDYLEEGQSWGAIDGARAFLQRHPDHVLGLDLRIEAEADRGFWRKVVGSLIHRMERIGPHPDSLELVARIPTDKIEPEEFLVMMELDPKNTGLLRMVEALRAEGRLDLAVEALGSIPEAQLQDETRLLLGELHLEGLRYREVVAVLEPIPPTSPHFFEAQALALRAAASARGPAVWKEATAHLAEVLDQADPSQGSALATARWLLVRGEHDLAARLLADLDRPDLRTGDGLNALALAQLWTGDAAAAEESVDRAEAFLPGPESHVTRMILLAETGRWPAIPAEVAHLRASEVELSGLIDIALLALAERVPEAAAAAQRALEDGAGEPEWLLLLAACNALLPEEDRLPTAVDPYPEQTAAFAAPEGGDARRTILLLLALETVEGATWTLRRLEAQDDPEAGRLWPAWLRARALTRLGHPALAKPLWIDIAKGSPTFRWSWDRLIDAERAFAGAYSPALVNLQDRRLAALGPEAGGPAWAAVVQANRLARQGSADKAREHLSGALADLGGAPLVGIVLARHQRDAGLRAEATLSFGEALGRAGSEDAAALLEEFLDLGRTAFEERTLSAAAWRAQLSALLTQLPEHPLVSLAWSAFLRADTDDAVLGWSAAREEYYRFREATGWRSLDELHPGSAAAWAAFFLSENPREAEQMIRDELPRSPGSAELWRLLPEALVQQGKIDDAFERYLALVRILPDPQALRAAAQILADRGSDHALLESTIATIQAQDPREEADLGLELLRTISRSREGGTSAEQALLLFDQLWQARDRFENPADVQHLAQGFSTALLHYGGPAPAMRALEVLAQVDPSHTTAFDRDYLRALAYLAQWIPVVEAVKAAEAADGAEPASAEADEG